MCLVGFLASPPAFGRYRFKTNQDQNGDRCLDEDPAEIVRRNHGLGSRVRQHVAAGIFFWICDGEGNWFAGLVKLRLGNAVGIADDGAILGVGRKLVGVCCQRLSVVIECRRPRRMIRAIAQGEHAEDEQCGNLDDIDCEIYRCRCASALLRDPGNEERKHDGDHGHKDRAGIGTANEVRVEESHHVSDEDAGSGHHHAWIDSVVKV